MSFFALCPLSFVPMRIDPDHRLEMSNQVVFGELVEVLEENNSGWWRVKVLYDGYEGWIRNNQLMKTDFFESAKIYSTDWVTATMLNGYPVRIPYGSDLTFLQKNGLLKEMNAVEATTFEPSAVNLLKTASVFLNTTYLWGGRTVFAIDCSGFVQSVFKFFNVNLLRDARLQVTQGEALGFLEEARCGDLAFFDDEDGNIVHVGMLLSASQIIHASGQVRIDKIDSQGIVHSASGERTHKLRIIKRILSKT